MRRHTQKSVVLAVALVAGFVATSVPCRADVIISFGIQGGNDGAENVLFNGSDDVIGPATVVRGHVGQQQIQFGGKTTLATLGHGQAGITAADPSGVFDWLRIEFMPGSHEVFTKAIFNLDAAKSGDVLFTVFTAEGKLKSESFRLNSRGSNFFTLFGDVGDAIAAIEIDSSVGLKDIQQVRIGAADAQQVGFGASANDVDPTVAAVPEPQSIALLATIVAGIGLFAGRRWRHSR